jgi:hypothetical protein
MERIWSTRPDSEGLGSMTVGTGIFVTRFLAGVLRFAAAGAAIVHFLRKR